MQTTCFFLMDQIKNSRTGLRSAFFALQAQLGRHKLYFIHMFSASQGRDSRGIDADASSP